MTESSAEPRVPVSLVTGFLGSGKTTLIAALLRHPAMAGAAVIVNEFGAVGIDDAIFAQSLDAENVRLLANGCLCCTAGDDLAATVWSLARRSERPRRIVIETTGLAEPAAILRRLIGDPRLRGSIRLDAVVATIDALNGAATIAAEPTAARQAAVADRRIITKGDLAGEGAVDDLAARLRDLNPGSAVLRVDHGRAEPDAILSASLRGAGGVADVSHWLNRDPHISGRRSHERGPHAGTWLMEEERPIAWDSFVARLAPIIARHGNHLLRVKGVLYTVDDRRPLVIHGVQRVFHPPVRLDRWTVPRRTSIVAIGDGRAPGAIAEIGAALILSVASAAAA